MLFLVLVTLPYAAERGAAALVSAAEPMAAVTDVRRAV